MMIMVSASTGNQQLNVGPDPIDACYFFKTHIVLPLSVMREDM